MGCPRCGRGLGIHNAEWRRRIEEILWQHCQMNPEDDAQPKATATTTKSVLVEQEKPTGPAVQRGGTSGSARPANAASSSAMTPVVGLARAHHKPSKRAKTTVGLEICVLEAMDDVFDATLGEPGPNPSVHFDESVSEDNEVPLEVTHELNRLSAGQATTSTEHQRHDARTRRVWHEVQRTA